MTRFMTRFHLLALALLLLLTMGVVMAQETPDAGPLAGTQAFGALRAQAASAGPVRVIVALRETPGGLATAQASLLNTLSGTNARLERQFSVFPGMALTVDAAALDALARSPLVVSIAPDRLDTVTMDSTLPIIGVTGPGSATELGYLGTGQVVAVLDTGIDKNHSALTGQVVAEGCFNSNNAGLGGVSRCPGGVTSSTMSNSGLDCTFAEAGWGCAHGTHVAGTVASTNSTYRGVAPGAKLIAVNVFTRFNNLATCQSVGYASQPCVASFTSDQIAGLEYVYSLRNTYNIAAVNMSLGGTNYSSQADCDVAEASLRKPIIDLLRDAGIATVVSSGNSGLTAGMSAPACISSAISVGATNDNDTVASFSNSASFLTLLAPGFNVQSADAGTGGGFASLSGTSMAAPHVAGAWALLRQASPNASVTEVRNALINTGVSVTDTRSGAGNRVTPRIQVNAALMQFVTPPPSNVNAVPANYGSIAITWDQVPNNTGYRVQWSANGETGWTFFPGQLDTDVNSFLDATVSCGTLRYYRVFSFRDTVRSTASSPAGASTLDCPTEPDTNLLFNGNFDINEDDQPRIPDGWNPFGPMQGDRVRPVNANSAPNMFMFVGNPGEQSSLRQLIPFDTLTLTPGDALVIAMQVDQQTGVPNAVITRLQVFYSDGTREIVRLRLPLTPQPGYVPISVAHTLSRADVERVRVIVQYHPASGRVFIDDVTFGVASAASLPNLPQALPGTDGLIPLPAPADQ